MPPCAASNRPTRRRAAPVNAPASWPNSSLSSTEGDKRSAVELDERPAPTRGQEVDARRGEFLAGAALADEQDGPLDLGHAGELLLEIEEKVGFAKRLGALVGGSDGRLPPDEV